MNERFKKLTTPIISNGMKIYIATDHAGYDMKEALASYIEKDLGYTVADMGAHQNDPSDDYSDFIQLAAQEVSHDPSSSRGVVLGGSGQGEGNCRKSILRTCAVPSSTEAISTSLSLPVNITIRTCCHSVHDSFAR